MRSRLVVVLGLLSAASGPTRGADNPLAAARAGVEQWVQTRQLISRTRADWDSEREMMLQSKALFERELAGVEEQMAKVSTNSTQVDRERTAAEQELKQAEEALDRMRDLATDLEAKVRAILPRLPGPLLESLQPILNRLPADPKSTKASASERTQTLVSALNEIDKFNNAVNVFSEKRQNARGEAVAVETVYVGLGAAFFVNQTGDFAGVGQPGASGWDWSIDSGLAPSVREVVRIYRSEHPARFIPLPVTIR